MILGKEIQNATQALLRLDEDGALSVSEFGLPHHRPGCVQGDFDGWSGRRGGHLDFYKVAKDRKEDWVNKRVVGDAAMLRKGWVTSYGTASTMTER